MSPPDGTCEHMSGQGPRDEATFDRIRDFIIDAAQSDRPLTSEWRAALRDVALELDKLAYSKTAHPDSVSSAELAMSSLSGVWLDDDQKDQLYLGTLGDPYRDGES